MQSFYELHSVFWYLMRLIRLVNLQDKLYPSSGYKRGKKLGSLNNYL